MNAEKASYFADKEISVTFPLEQYSFFCTNTLAIVIANITPRGILMSAVIKKNRRDDTVFFIDKCPSHSNEWN